MSQPTPEQLTKVAEWAAAGASLNEVQGRLKEEFGLNLTYMDTRLLLLENGIKIKDKARESEKAAKRPAQPSEPAASKAGAAEDAWETAEPPATETEATPGSGGLSMSVDQITLPNAMVSGKVTFSDGQSASWYLDQMGRLGLANVPGGYRPPEADIPLFQQELERLLQKSGF